MAHHPPDRGPSPEQVGVGERRRGDTIAAVATPSGRGAVGIVRVSGSGVAAIAAGVLGRCPPPRQARFGAFRGAAGEALDHGLALFFAGPASYTGEDILELHGHGGRAVLELVLNRVQALGARPAAPGEFTQRAFLNGKLDLAQAEAVADLIDSQGAAAARAAVRSMGGALSTRANELAETLANLRAQVEAGIDFPDDDVDTMDDTALRAALTSVAERVATLGGEVRRGRRLRDGLTVAIAGAPNVGKSTLLNRLAGDDLAIVTPVPGTTRDPLWGRLELDGLAVDVVDTAGLRDSTDVVEREGVRRARAAVERADRVLVVLDASEPGTEPPSELPPHVPRTLIWNKVDLVAVPPAPPLEAEVVLALSALTGTGMDALERHLATLAGAADAGGDALLARQRHVDAVDRADHHLALAAAALAAGRSELLAEELRAAHEALATITGRFTTEDLLGRIFDNFCIGK